MSIHVAVVIVGYRNAEDIGRCIAALEKSAYRDFEVVICENGGSAAFAALQSGIPEMLRDGQRVTLIEAPFNGGYASGINIGMSASPAADAWWILNPDTEASPGAMTALTAHLALGYDAVGGPIHFPSGEIQSFGGIWLAWRAKAVLIGNGNPKGTNPDMRAIEGMQNFLSGASMFVSRSFLRMTGPMPEHFFLYCEEVDWFLRAAARGARLGFAPDAVVIHHQGTTTGYSRSLRQRSVTSVFLDERNKMLLTREHFPARLPVVAVLALLRLTGRYLRAGAFRQTAYGIWGWLAGLRGEQGIPAWMQGARG